MFISYVHKHTLYRVKPRTVAWSLSRVIRGADVEARMIRSSAYIPLFLSLLLLSYLLR